MCGRSTGKGENLKIEGGDVKIWKLERYEKAKKAYD